MKQPININRFSYLAGVTIALFCMSATAEAQSRSFGSPRGNRPVTSPYLNLLDTNNSTTFNYFRRVRPENEFRSANTQNARSIYDLKRQAQQRTPMLGQDPNSRLGITGHPTSFLSYGSYFGSSPLGR